MAADSDSFNELIREAQAKYLSRSEIERITEGQCKVVLYSELIDCQTLEDAAAPYDACICLFESKPLSGHWVLWFKVKEEVWEWFDSYGVRPDAELKWLSREVKDATRQRDFITQLVKKSSESTRMIYNQVQLQSVSSKINTCGRWVSIRLRKRHLPLKQFQELFYRNGDYKVTALTLLFDETFQD